MASLPRAKPAHLSTVQVALITGAVTLAVTTLVILLIFHFGTGGYVWSIFSWSDDMGVRSTETQIRQKDLNVKYTAMTVNIYKNVEQAAIGVRQMKNRPKYLVHDQIYMYDAPTNSYIAIPGQDISKYPDLQADLVAASNAMG